MFVFADERRADRGIDLEHAAVDPEDRGRYRRCSFLLRIRDERARCRLT